MRRRVVFVVIIVTVLLGAGGGIAWYLHQWSGYRLLVRAELAGKAGKFDKAIGLADRYIAESPDDWRGYYVKGRIHCRAGRFAEGRGPLEQASKLKPRELSVWLALADTFSLPARKTLILRDPAEDPGALREAIDLLKQAEKVLRNAQVHGEREQLSLREQIGLNTMRIGVAQKLLGERLVREAEIADTSRSLRVAARKRRESQAVLGEADQQTRQAIEILCGVVVAAPSRAVAAEMAVRLCLRQDDRKSLGILRAAIMGLEAPPPTAATMLVMDDLKTREAKLTTSGREAVRRETCHALDRILQHYPDAIDVKVTRADLAIQMGDSATAERLCAEVVDVAPRNPQCRMINAKILAARGDLSGAERILFALKTDFPQWVLAQYAYASIAADAGYLELAREAMRAVTKIDPAHAASRRFLAESLLRHGFYRQALVDASAYRQAHPARADALKLYVESLIRTDQPMLAQQLLASDRREYRDRPDVLIAVAEMYAILGNNAEAMKVARQAAEAKATSAAARLAVARALLLIGRAPEAEKTLLEELAHDPRQPRVSFELARLYTATGRIPQALEQYRTTVRLESHNPTYRLALAQALLDSGDLRECQEVLKGVHPSNPIAGLLQLQIKLLRGEPVTTGQILQEVREGQRAGLPLALIYLNNGQPKRCVEICREELQKTPDDLNVRLLLGQAHLSLGNTEKCVKEWTQVLKAAPEQIATYLRLAVVLSRKVAPEQVAFRLNLIPGANRDMVDLATGRLFAQAGDLDRAAITYGRVADRPTAVDYVRGQARMLRAECLARRGETDRATAELDRLAASPMWGKRARFAKATFLLASGRASEAVRELDELQKTASEQQDAPLLRRIAVVYVKAKQTDKAMKVTEQVLQLLPNDARSYLLKAGVLAAAGQKQEAIEAYRQAVRRQPGNFRIHLSLARQLDGEGQPLKAMEVLEELEGFGQTGRSVGLFEQGGMLARWGLQGQAVERLEELASLGYSDNPRLMLAMGEAFARLGKKDRACEILRAIPIYTPQYVPAQQILAQMAETQQEKLAILRRLKEARPDQVAISLQEMSILLQSDLPEKAVEVFREYEARRPAGGLLGSGASYLALLAMLEVDDVKAAAELSVKMAGQSRAPIWRHLAVLLCTEADPDSAARILRETARTNLYDTLNGVVLSARKGDGRSGERWLARLDELAREVGSPGSPAVFPQAYRILANIAAGRAPEAARQLKEFKGTGFLLRGMAAEMVSSTPAKSGTSAEAVRLLQATMAFDLGLVSLGRSWAMEVLKARPACQWAAALAVQQRATSAVYREVLSLLRPRDCPLAQLINASLLMSEREYARSAELYRAAGAVEKGNMEIMLWQGLATERAGRLTEALELYRTVWNTSRRPMAANNAAYVLSQLSQNDSARLSEAHKWVNEALKTDPRSPLFRDTLGWIQYLQGEYNLACTELWRAVKGLPDTLEVHYHLGLAEAAAGRVGLARWHLEATLSIGLKLKAEGKKIDVHTEKAIEMAGKALSALPAPKPAGR